MRNMLKFNGQTVRHVMIDDAPWFVAVDVCRCLRLNVETGSYDHVRHLSGGEKWTVRKRDTYSNPGKNTGSVRALFQGAQRGAITLISESGLYKLIMRAHPSRPEVSLFQDWMTQEVLPFIRKTGEYRRDGSLKPLPSPEVIPAQTLPASHQVPLDKLAPFQPLPGSIAQRLRMLADEIEDLTRRFAA